MDNYEWILRDGVSMTQINQIEKIKDKNPYVDKDYIFNNISGDVDINLLRKFVNAINEDKFENKKIADYATELVLKNVDFEPLFLNVSKHKKDFIFKVLNTPEYPYKEEMIEVVKGDNISGRKDSFDLRLLNANLRDNVNSAAYITPQLNSDALTAAYDAYIDNNLKALDVINEIDFDKIKGAYDVYENVKFAMEHNIDIKNTITEVPYELLPFTLECKAKGFDVDELAKKLGNRDVVRYAERMIESMDATPKEVIDFFEEYPEMAKLDYNKADLIISAYYDGFKDIRLLMDNNLNANVIRWIKDIYDFVDEDSKKILLNKTFEDYEYRLMDSCVNYKRFDLLPTIIQSEKPDERTYSNIKELLYYNFKGPIDKLLFDKNNKEYEIEEKEQLTSIFLGRHKSEIDPEKFKKEIDTVDILFTSKYIPDNKMENVVDALMVKNLGMLGYSEDLAKEIIETSNYLNLNSVLPFIRPEIDVEILKKLNYALKNDFIKDSDNLKNILYLILHNESIDSLLEEMPSWKQDICIYAKLHDKVNAEKIIECLKKDKANYEYESCDIKNDIGENINVLEYLEPDFSKQQRVAYRFAIRDGRNDLKDVIAKMNPNNCNYFDIKRAEECDFDICELSHKLTDQGLSEYIRSKESGYELADIYEKPLSEGEQYFIRSLVKKNYPESEIRDYLTKFDSNYIEKLGNAMYVISKEEYTPVEKNLFNAILERANDHTIKDYQLELIALRRHIDPYGLDAVIKDDNPDPAIYSILKNIVTKERKQDKVVGLTCFFFDKKGDKTGKSDPSLKFNNLQSMVLASAYYNELINMDQLKLLRDNKIDAEVMNVFCKMANKGIDIEPYMKKAPKMTKEDITKIYEDLTKNTPKKEEIQNDYSEDDFER